MKYKNMTQGVYLPHNDEKEGKVSSFQSGQLPNPSLKLGQPGPCQGLCPTEDMFPSGAEKGQSHLADPVQRPSCPLA